MAPHDDTFQQDILEQQLDALSQTSEQWPNEPARRAYVALSRLHAAQAQAEAQALERVRQRVVASAAQAMETEQNTGPDVSTPATRQPEPSIPHHPRRSRRLSRPRAILSGVAAVLAVGALIGGFVAVLHTRAPQTTPIVSSEQWRIMHSPNSSQAVNALSGIAVGGASDAWVVGWTADGPTQATANPASTPLVEHWDGASWRIVNTPALANGGQLNDVVSLAPDDAWAVGSYLATPPSSNNTYGAPLIEHWDGMRWTIVPGNATPGQDSSLTKIAAISSDDIWAVGTVDAKGLVEHWNGRGWQTVALGVGSAPVRLADVVALASNDVWIAGNLSQGGTAHNPKSSSIFWHWDGSVWQIIPGPDTGSSYNVLFSMAAASSNDIWAAGVVVTDPSVRFAPEALYDHWNGQRWSAAVLPTPAMAVITDITALGPDDVWAVGTVGVGADTSQQGQALVEHWDGRRWSVVNSPSPRPFTGLTAIAGDPSAPGKVWIAGMIGPPTSRDQLSNTATLIETNQ